MDKYDRETRSRMMRAVRSKGTQLEERARGLLVKAWGKRGLQDHPDLPGKPDFARRTKGATIVVFVDSCYWHGCQLHHRPPRSNVSFWRAKIKRNRHRDREVTRDLRRSGYKVVRVWEHELLRPTQLLARIQPLLIAARASGRIAGIDRSSDG